MILFFLPRQLIYYTSLHLQQAKSMLNTLIRSRGFVGSNPLDYFHFHKAQRNLT